MYIPKSFAETDLPTLHAFIQAHNFATVVSQADGALHASHVPLMLDPTRGPYGTLTGHLARANPQWKGFSATSELLVIFQGPHAYISPTWYTVHPSVPTWNYTAVHAYGVPIMIDDATALEHMVTQLVVQHEQARQPAWEMDLPTDYMDKMLKAIVGFEIQITRLEGKYKLSQNRAEADQHNVIAGLAASDSPVEQETAAIMQQRRDETTAPR